MSNKAIFIHGLATLLRGGGWKMPQICGQTVHKFYWQRQKGTKIVSKLCGCHKRKPPNPRSMDASSSAANAANLSLLPRNLRRGGEMAKAIPVDCANLRKRLHSHTLCLISCFVGVTSVWNYTQWWANRAFVVIFHRRVKHKKVLTDGVFNYFTCYIVNDWGCDWFRD